MTADVEVLSDYKGTGDMSFTTVDGDVDGGYGTGRSLLQGSYCYGGVGRNVQPEPGDFEVTLDSLLASNDECTPL